MVQQDEVLLIPTESITYRSKVLSEMRATYSKGYSNFFVELVPASQAVIVYECEKKFTTGWNCTNTKYGKVTGKDMLAAEKSFATLQAEYKDYSFKEVRRWGKAAILTPAAVGENDLAVKWITTSKGYFLKMTNTRKDVALKITIVSYKRKAGTQVAAGEEADLSKMVKSDETTLVIEPGSTAQNSFTKADGFEIKISQKAATPEEQSLIDKVKQLIKSYATCPNYKCEVKQVSKSIGGGVRG